MSNITASEVNELRKITGAGMMDCKNALAEAGGDIDKAIEILRKKGQKVSEKRADKEAREGLIIAITSADNSRGVLAQLVCETDFVAKNDEFVALAENIAKIALENNIFDSEQLMNSPLNGMKVIDHLNGLIGKIGEKIELKNIALLNGKTVVSYIHSGNKIGVLVTLNQTATDEILQAGRDVSMQIAAMNPLGLNKDNIDPQIINRELEIAKEQMINEGKPENLVEKIALGKLNKFFAENTLLSQAFVKDSSLSVEKMLKQIHPDLTVEAFERLEIG